MGDFDWTAALDAAGSGHNLVGAKKVREFMAAAGITGMPLAPCEEEEVRRLRESAERCSASADAIEARVDRNGWT